MRANLRATIEVKAGSQTAFAQKSGIELSRLNRIIRGWLEPTPIERDRCTELLGVDTDWLFRIFTIPNQAPVTGGEDFSRLAREITRELSRITEEIDSKF